MVRCQLFDPDENSLSLLLVCPSLFVQYTFVKVGLVNCTLFEELCIIKHRHFRNSQYELTIIVLICAWAMWACLPFSFRILLVVCFSFCSSFFNSSEYISSASVVVIVFCSNFVRAVFHARGGYSFGFCFLHSFGLECLWVWYCPLGLFHRT